MDINTCFATIADLRSLASYANFVPAATSIILAGFVLRRSVNRQKAVAFASFIGVFSLWLIAAGIIWTSNNYYLVAALWSPIDYFQLIFFLLLFCFFYLDIFVSIPRWLSSIVLFVAVAPFIINLLGQGAFGFDQPWCNMNNNEFLTSYDLWVGIVILITILGLGTYRILKSKNNKNERTRLIIITVSIALFMGIFLGSEYWSSITNVYTTELYALFTLPIFILLLTIAITSYGTFRLGDTAAKVLFYIYLVSSGALFFFVTSTASLAVITIAFVMALSFGVLLLQKYEEVELLARGLKIANEMQADTTSLITHQIRGVFTNTKSGLSTIIEGDYGPVPPQLMSVMDSMFKSQVIGVKTVETFLQAQKIESGTIQYDKKPFDLKAVVEEKFAQEKPRTDTKGLQYELQIDDGDYMFNGDQIYLTQVIANLIDNAIRYTEKGSIKIQLSHTDSSVLYSVKDSGIGIPDGDKEKMFTKYGHGKDSRKTNVASSGLGLYIVKGIVMGHGGKIWYETEVGKGTTFFVELPVSQKAAAADRVSVRIYS